MGNEKNLTIGITINLENYENLRLEIEGEICDENDAAMLIADLDRILSGLGRGDEVAAERIDSYRRRVLSQGKNPEKWMESMEKHSEIKKEEEPIKTNSPLGHKPDKKTERKEREAIKDTGLLSSYQREEDTAKPAPADEPSPEISKEPDKEGPKEKTEILCESCGAHITEKQRKISQMFTDKTLCEKCIQAEKGMK